MNSALSLVTSYFRALSFCNLLALPVWIALFRADARYTKSSGDYLGAVFFLFGSACALWLVDKALGRALGARYARIRVGLALCCLTLLAWGIVRPYVGIWIPMLFYFGKLLPLVVMSMVAAGVFLLVLRYPAGFLDLCAKLIIVLSPFVLFTAGNALHRASAVEQREVREAALPSAWQHLPDSSRKTRIVVVLFDEFDYEVGFEKRAAKQVLPEFDRFRGTSVFATHAYPPAHSTSMSVPAMLTGKLVARSREDGELAGDKRLVFADNSEARLSLQASVFSDARARGKTSLRMSAAYLPDFVLKGGFDADQVVPVHPTGSDTVGEGFFEALLGVLGTVPFSETIGVDQALRVATGIKPAAALVAGAVETAADLAAHADADLIYLHLLLPHLPTVFDPATGRFVWSGRQSYEANLMGADHALGKIRKALEAAGRWDATTLLIKSDHFFRLKRPVYGLGDHRVPFIVKLSGQHAGAVLDQPFNLVLFRPLMTALLSSSVEDAAQLSTWIGQSATFAESPLTVYREGW